MTSRTPGSPWSDALRWRSQEHQRQGSVGRPGYRLHKAGQAWLGRLRGMQYQKCRLCIEGGPEQTLGETTGGRDQVLYYSEALPTTARILYRSFTPKRTQT